MFGQHRGDATTASLLERRATLQSDLALPPRPPRRIRLSVGPSTGGFSGQRARACLLCLCLGSMVCGCDRRERPAADPPPPKRAEKRADQPPTGGSAVDEAIPVDDQDAPGSPPALPKSSRLGAWIKVRPVRLAAGEEIGAALGDARRAERLAGFRVERLATCAYRRRGDESDRTANLELFETVSAADALGMLLAESSGENHPAGPGMIGFIRAQRQAGRAEWYGWQGYHYVHLWVNAEADPDLTKTVEQLLGDILLSTPGAPVPALLEFLPHDGRHPGQVWLVRSARALRGPSGPKLRWPDHQAADKLLGLRGDALMALGGYCVPGSEEVNYVFVVQYPTADEAQAAFGRLSHQSGPLALPCLLTDPVGERLAGSFTPESESVAHVLPVARRGLLSAEGGQP